MYRMLIFGPWKRTKTTMYSQHIRHLTLWGGLVTVVLKPHIYFCFLLLTAYAFKLSPMCISLPRSFLICPLFSKKNNKGIFKKTNKKQVGNEVSVQSALMEEVCVFIFAKCVNGVHFKICTPVQYICT